MLVALSDLGKCSRFDRKVQDSPVPGLLLCALGWNLSKRRKRTATADELVLPRFCEDGMLFHHLDLKRGNSVD